MKVKFSFVLITVLLVSMLTSCATTMIMGSGFQEVDKGTYVLKVGTGGVVSLQEEASKAVLDEEAKKFLTENKQYSSYTVIKMENSLFPLTYYQYTVKFE